MRKIHQLLILALPLVGMLWLGACSDELIAEGSTDNSTFSRGENESNADATPKEWYTNWEKFDTIGVGARGKVYTPWSPHVDLYISSSVIKGLTKANGWEMAFCHLNDEIAKNTCYFGLYNRYLGLLRVFCHIWTEQVLASGEGAFEIFYGDINNKKDVLYPFYNSLAYSIPTSHGIGSGKPLLLNQKLLDCPIAQSFHDYKVPPITITSKTLKEGWVCFDLNLSGYVPAGKRWNFDSSADQLIKMVCLSQSTANISISGTLKSKIQGTITDQELIDKAAVSPVSGWSATFEELGTTLGTISSFGRDAMETIQLFNDPSQMGCCDWLDYFASGCTSMASLLSGIDPDLPPEYDTIPGKIDLSLDGTIDLKGTMTQWTNNGVGSLTVNNNLLKKAKDMKKSEGLATDSSSIGKGIVSLADDPVICVAKDDIMAEVWGFSMLIDNEKDFKYTNPHFDQYKARIMTFLDPTSIKVNLNTELYKNVTDVKVHATCYVYPDAPYGSTSAFREMLGLDNNNQRPIVNLSCGKNKGDLRFSEFDSDAQIRLHRIRCTELLRDLKSKKKPEFYAVETPTNCEIVQQKDANFQYYGRICNIGNKKIIYEPQVFIPYARKKGSGGDAENINVYDGQLPDFVVAVLISFKADGKPYYFTQHYLPRYEMLSHEDLLKYRDNIRNFTQQSLNGKPNGHLENNPKIEVKFPFAYGMTYKSLKMLSYLDR